MALFLHLFRSLAFNFSFSARFKSQSLGVAVKFNKSITRFFIFFSYFWCISAFGHTDWKNQVFFTSIQLGWYSKFIFSSLDTKRPKKKTRNQKNHFKSTNLCVTLLFGLLVERSNRNNDYHNTILFSISSFLSSSLFIFLLWVIFQIEKPFKVLRTEVKQ